eukprot:scaffold987_cov183-Amphora_coffeaeformis.AAC.9
MQKSIEVSEAVLEVAGVPVSSRVHLGFFRGKLEMSFAFGVLMKDVLEEQCAERRAGPLYFSKNHFLLNGVGSLIWKSVPSTMGVRKVGRTTIPIMFMPAQGCAVTESSDALTYIFQPSREVVAV